MSDYSQLARVLTSASLAALLAVPASAAAAQGTATAAIQKPASGQPAAAQAAVPRVHLLATGGTISNRDGGRLTAEELARSMPGLDNYAQLTYEQFANVASGALTLDQWVQLAKKVNETFASDRTLGGIVVTSGTDTLEETAFFLHLTVTDPRPVVVVGSMRNPSTLGYEGAANLLEAVRVAADPAARDQGALVVMNDEINSARDVTKTDALRMQTFRSGEHGLLGVVDRDRVVFYRKIVQRHNAALEFDVRSIGELPRVDVIMVYQGASGDLIKAAVDAGAKGIVMATAGAGATSGTQSEGLNYAAEKGVFVVTSTRTGSGRIAPSGPPPAGQTLTEAQLRRRAFSIQSDDHTPVKSRILLMLALTKFKDREQIQRVFSEY